MFIDDQTVRYEDFVAAVMQRMQTSSPLLALEAIRATFRTLGDCLSGAEADDLADELPRTIGSFLRRQDWETGERLTTDEFIARAAGREDICKTTAWQHISAVLFTAGTFAIPSEAIRDRIEADVPSEIAALWSFRQLPEENAHMHQLVVT